MNADRVARFGSPLLENVALALQPGYVHSDLMAAPDTLQPLTTDPVPRLPRWARLADLLSVTLLGLALYIAAHGGGVNRVAGIRLALRSEWRILFWVGALILVRHVLVRRDPLPRRIVRGVRTIARWHGPLQDDAMCAVSNKAADRGTKATRSRRLVTAVGVLALFATLTVILTYPQVRLLTTSVTPDFGDPLLSTWRLAWFAHQLPRDPLHLFDGNIFYPERFTLAFSDSMLVPSLTIAPLMWLGVPQLVAYNLLLLSAFAFSGAAMFFLVRSLTGHTGAALIAGFVFAFLPYRFMHYAHLELQMAQWMPLCLWSLHRVLVDGRTRYGVATGLFLALQTLSSIYYGIFLATYLLPVIVALWLCASREARRHVIRPLAAGAMVAALIIVPATIPYFEARKAVGERPSSEIQFYSATPRNYLAAHPRNALLGRVTAHWGGQERELFQGIVVPALAVAALWPPLSAARIAYATGLVVAFDGSLGFNGTLYPLLHKYLLPYHGLRVPARMAILVGLSLSILVGFAVARIASRMGGRRAFLVVAAIFALVFVEYRTTLPLEEVWTKPPVVYDALPADPQTVVLEWPLIRPDIALEPVFMYFSTFRWRTLLNGYSGFEPESYIRLENALRRFPDDTSVAELRRRSVEYVIVHGAFMPPRDYNLLVGQLDGSSDFQPVVSAQWQGRETRLYRLVGVGGAGGPGSVGRSRSR
jgi:hypothetical protein